MLMRDEDYAKLLEDTEHELLAGRGPAGVLGPDSGDPAAAGIAGGLRPG